MKIHENQFRDSKDPIHLKQEKLRKKGINTKIHQSETAANTKKWKIS